MTATLENIVEKVEQLQAAELEELLTWLAERELSKMDAWDMQLEEDSKPGGRLASMLGRVRGDIAAGRTKTLDEVLDNS